MKTSTSKIFLFLFFVIYPLGSLPFIFFEIYHKRYYALNFLAVFMGLLAFLWIPSGDLYRIQEDFEVIKRVNFFSLLSVNSLDYAYDIILFIFGRLNLDFAYIRFFICIFSYMLFFNVVKNIINNNFYFSSSKIYSFFTFLTFFFLLRFSGFLTGVRFTFAFSLFLYGFYNLFYKSGIKGTLFLVTSSLVHFSFWILFLVVLIQKIFSFKFNRLFIIVLLSVSFLFSSYFFPFIINILPLDNSLKTHLENYTIGFFALEEYQTKSILYRISVFLSYFTIYPALIYVLIKRRISSDFSLFILMFILLLLSFYMNTIFSRYAFITVFLFTVPFVVNLKRLTSKFFHLIFMCSFITYLGSIQTVKRELKFGKQYKILYYSLPLIMNSKYDNKWIISNIDNRGDIIKAE